MYFIIAISDLSSDLIKRRKRIKGLRARSKLFRARYVYADDEYPANGDANGEALRGCVDAYGVKIQVGQDARGCGVRRRADGNVRVLSHHDYARGHGLPSKETQYQR